ncbi:apoptosis antagonizing transcription factor-domain-containing protein [Jimgerdemannia flammicorona]|uniref:Protein BFR2 n=1 Tax=Jimgerdemannia flammicorona TaxID=994334 RepID=A0A433D5R0_9FUNG|nr:apoptosis antagonizing transcription factor-domain-containing protein [Jimgerdemannia flammicorona]
MSKSLADKLAEMDSSAPADFDPEDFGESVFNDMPDRDSGGSDDEALDNSVAAREHYIQVGKSAIRRKQQFLMDDPKYSGKRSSRQAIFDQGEDDEVKEGQGQEEDEFREEDEGSEDHNLSEGDGTEDDEFRRNGNDENTFEEPEALKNELAKIEEEERILIRNMSQSAKADVEKGQHVKTQLGLWDAFLDTRIRIQKAVVIANQLPQWDTMPVFLTQNDRATSVLDDAKSELRGLIDSILDVRVGLCHDNDVIVLPKGAATSRKRHFNNDDEYIDHLWQDIRELDDIFLPYRNQTVEKWGNKMQIASGIPLNKKFKAFDQSILTQMNSILADRERLVKRTQLKRSEFRSLGKVNHLLCVCAGSGWSGMHDFSVEFSAPYLSYRFYPSNAIAVDPPTDYHLTHHDPEIFDDTDFYGQLLRELIESRMVDATDDPAAAGLRWAALKQSKQRKKIVDTKASKGRRLRYHVHEKLQNFMAPVPAGTWHEEMTDELYASLLGKSGRSMDEGSKDEAEEETKSMDVNGAAIDGLRIFG